MKHVYLDLEETVINNWHDGLIIYSCKKVSKWLDKNLSPKIDDLNIFSFAIYNDEDKETFHKILEPMLTVEMGYFFDKVLTVDEIKKIVERNEKFSYEDRLEFVQLNGKQWSFIKYCRAVHKNCECYLIDDMVENMTVKYDDIGLTIHLINVKLME